jgi:hypothetical protein
MGECPVAVETVPPDLSEPGDTGPSIRWRSSSGLHLVSHPALRGPWATQVLLGKEQVRSLDHLFTRFASMLSKIQSYAHLDHLLLNEKDLLEGTTALADSLEKAAVDLMGPPRRKRALAGRLLWLPDEQLMELYEIWCAARESTTASIDHYVGLLFPSVEGLIWRPSRAPGQRNSVLQLDALGGRPSTGALGVRSVDGLEELHFHEPLPRIGTLENWINGLDDRIFDHLHRTLHEAWMKLDAFQASQTEEEGGGDVGFFPVAFRSIFEGEREAIPVVQCAVVRLQLAWTRTVEAIFDTDSPKAVREFAGLIAACATKAASGLWTKWHTQSPYLYSNALLLAISYRDMAETFAKSGVSSKEDFVWQSHVRHYYKDMERVATEKPGRAASIATNIPTRSVKVNIGPWSFWYGYEYQAPNVRLAANAQSERYLLSLATAVKQGSLPFLQPDDACYDRAIAAELAVALGRPQVRYSPMSATGEGRAAGAS